MEKTASTDGVSALLGKIDFVQERLDVRAEKIEHYPWLEKNDLSALMDALRADLQQPGIGSQLYDVDTRSQSRLSQGITRMMKAALEIAEGMDDQGRIEIIVQEAQRLQNGSHQFARTVGAAEELSAFLTHETHEPYGLLMS